MVRVIARKPHIYNSIPRNSGEVYEAHERDVLFLQAFGNAEPEPADTPEVVPVPVSDQSVPERKGRYKRRDMRAQ
jgi:hypothetical protein